jgi:predicted Zn-dependent protease
LYTDLAEALVKLDRGSEAIAALQKASELDPFNATLRKTLIVQLIQAKDYPKAKSEMEDYVERFPQDSFMRQMLTRAQAAGRPQ